MRFAYADPPYLGLGVSFYGPEAAIYDTLDGHRQLVERLSAFDGWAYVASFAVAQGDSPTLPR